MAAQSESNKYKYAYCILFYEGDDERERGECKAFVEMLEKRFQKKIGIDNKYSVFSQWSDQVGKSKLTVHADVAKKSFFTIVLFSPKYDEQRLTKYFGENHFTSLLDNGRYIPVFIDGAKVPQYLNAIGPCRFNRDFRTDETSWNVVLKSICKEKSHFREKTASGDESDSEDDHPDENQEEEERSGIKEFLTDVKIDELAGKIGHERKQLGIQLGFSNSEIQQIEDDHARNTRNQVFTMVLLWRQRSKKEQHKKKSELKKAFKTCGRLDLVSLVENWFQEYLVEEKQQQQRAEERKQKQKSAKYHKKADEELQMGVKESEEESPTRSKEGEQDHSSSSTQSSGQNFSTGKGDHMRSGLPYPQTDKRPHQYQGDAIGGLVPQNMGADSDSHFDRLTAVVGISGLDMNDGSSKSHENGVLTYQKDEFDNNNSSNDLVPPQKEQPTVGADVNTKRRSPVGAEQLPNDVNQTEVKRRMDPPHQSMSLGLTLHDHYPREHSPNRNVPSNRQPQNEAPVQAGPNETAGNQPPAVLSHPCVSPIGSHADNLTESATNHKQQGHNTGEMVERLPPAGEEQLIFVEPQRMENTDNEQTNQGQNERQNDITDETGQEQNQEPTTNGQTATGMRQEHVDVKGNTSDLCRGQQPSSTGHSSDPNQNQTQPGPGNPNNNNRDRMPQQNPDEGLPENEEPQRMENTDNEQTNQGQNERQNDITDETGQEQNQEPTTNGQTATGMRQEHVDVKGNTSDLCRGQQPSSTGHSSDPNQNQTQPGPGNPNNNNRDRMPQQNPDEGLPENEEPQRMENTDNEQTNQGQNERQNDITDETGQEQNQEPTTNGQTATGMRQEHVDVKGNTSDLCRGQQPSSTGHFSDPNQNQTQPGPGNPNNNNRDRMPQQNPDEVLPENEGGFLNSLRGFVSRVFTVDWVYTDG